MCSSISDTRGSASTSMPCSSAGSRLPVRPTIAWTSTYGAAPCVPGTASARPATAGQSANRSAGPVTLACEVSATSRPRNSPSKPFITDTIVISAATPRQTPSIDTHEMNDTKNPWRRVRT